MSDTKKIDKEYIVGTYARFPLEIVRGKGSLVYDENGKEYIDLGTGIAEKTFGVAADVITQSVTDQMKKFSQTSNF